ncbi:MAG: 6-carboxytetrahydropterin synthase QueD [bacterium]
MFYIKVRGEFSAAHRIVGYPGKCGSIHGHRWEVIVEVKVDRLNKIGMGMDFSILKEKLQNIINSLDHRYLNEIEPFSSVNPTAENIAKFIYYALKEQMGEDFRLCSVEIFEGANSSVRYIEETTDA